MVVDEYCKMCPKNRNVFRALISSVLNRTRYSLISKDHKARSDTAATSASEGHAPKIETFMEREKGNTARM